MAYNETIPAYSSVLLWPRFVPVVVTPCLPYHYIETRYHVHATRIPFYWLDQFCLPQGDQWRRVSNLHVAGVRTLGVPQWTAKN